MAEFAALFGIGRFDSSYFDRITREDNIERTVYIDRERPKDVYIDRTKEIDVNIEQTKEIEVEL